MPALSKPQQWVVNTEQVAAPDFWRGLVSCIPALDGILYDYVGKKLGTRVGQPTVVGTIVGRGINYDRVGAQGTTFADDTRYRRPSSAVTVAAVIIKTGDNGFASGLYYGKHEDASGWGRSWGIEGDDSGSVADGSPRFAISNGSGVSVTTPVEITQGIPFLCVGRWIAGSGTEFLVYNILTGGLLASVTGSSLSGTLVYDASALYINHKVGGNYQDHTFLGGYAWSRKLSDVEVRKLVEDPWAIVRPRREIFTHTDGGAGTQTITPDAVVATFALGTPTVTPGSVTITPNAAAATFVIGTPTASEANIPQTATLDPAIATFAPANPTVSEANIPQSAAPDPAVATFALGSPTIVSGQQASPDPAVATFVVANPTGSEANIPQTATLDPAVATFVIADPVVVGPTTLSPEVAAATFQVPSLEASGGAVAAQYPLISNDLVDIIDQPER